MSSGPAQLRKELRLLRFQEGQRNSYGKSDAFLEAADYLASAANQTYDYQCEITIRACAELLRHRARELRYQVNV